MKVEKKVVDHIEKCYAISEFYYNGERHLLCSAEGNGPCRIYDMEGKWVETIWEGPGGVMTLLQVPNTETPILLTTQGFYSPDHAEDSKIVYYFKIGEQWKCETLCNLPFVHRFGIVSNGKRNYLVAATLKSANAFDGDWTCPGRVWTAPLPENILEYNCKNPLVLEPLISGLYKNHGFSINREGNRSYVVIGAENGVYTVFPPKTEKENWRYEKILEEPVSDMLYRDFDRDGEKELLVLSPFHGNQIRIFKKNRKIYEREKKMPFAHALWGGTVAGKEYAFIGGRDGEKELIALSYDQEKQCFTETVLDTGAGAANVMLFQVKGECRLLTANRETDEVAVYVLS